jgi:hypothetical protein
MNASLRDLKRHAEGLTPPPLDLDHIVARGDARLGRRRAGLAAGTAGLAVAVVATALAFTRSDEQTGSPIGDPTPSVNETPAAAAPVRRLTYADVPAEQAPNWRIHAIHYGEQLAPLGHVVHLDLTDDGLVVLNEDGTVYHFYGDWIEELGTATIDQQSWTDTAVKTSAVGSMVAWFAPSGPDRSLVVYDAHERRTVAEVPVRDCESDDCRIETVTEARVYWSTSSDGPTPWADAPGTRPLEMLDLRSGAVSDTDAAALWEDLRSHPRSFVKGDSFDRGEVVNQDVNTEAVFFHPVDGTLELSRAVRETSDGEAVYAYGGYDTTGRRLHLRLPEGYPPAEAPYVLFQWLDDDRFAVMSGATHTTFGNGWNGFRGYGDILVCDIAREACTLEVPGPTGDDYRIVPHLDVPN